MTMKASKMLGLFAVMSLSMVLSGCSILYDARFSPPFTQESTVVLREDDFQYVDRNLRGSYSYWVLTLGIPREFFGSTAGIEIPLGDPRLFSKSLARMYDSVDEMAEDQPSQMINWTLDQESLMIPVPLLPTRRSATFRADLIEYNKM